MTDFLKELGRRVLAYDCAMGTNVLLIETRRDLLHAKIAIAAFQDAIRDACEGKIPGRSSLLREPAF